MGGAGQYGCPSHLLLKASESENLALWRWSNPEAQSACLSKSLFKKKNEAILCISTLTAAMSAAQQLLVGHGYVAKVAYDGTATFTDPDPAVCHAIALPSWLSHLNDSCYQDLSIVSHHEDKYHWEKWENIAGKLCPIMMTNTIEKYGRP